MAHTFQQYNSTKILRTWGLPPGGGLPNGKRPSIL
jgi:hypothetical protein